MSRLFKPVFRDPQKKKISDPDHIDDFRTSPSIGRVTLGKLCLYYRDLGKKYCVPYDYIQQVYTKVETCAEDEFANNQEYYRVIFLNNGTEFANLIFAKQPQVHSLYEELKAKNPEIVFGKK